MVAGGKVPSPAAMGMGAEAGGAARPTSQELPPPPDYMLADGDIKEAAGGVKEVARALREGESKQQPRVLSSGSEEDCFGYSEGCDDISIGIDLPRGGGGGSSGNATPAPTTGELEDVVEVMVNGSTSPSKKVHFAQQQDSPMQE